MNNSITQQHVDAQIVDIQVTTVYDKVTVVSVRLRNGFVLVESAGAVDKANYSEHVGANICLERIKNKIWELEGYRLSSQLASAAVRDATIYNLRTALQDVVTCFELAPATITPERLEAWKAALQPV